MEMKAPRQEPTFEGDRGVARLGELARQLDVNYPAPPASPADYAQPAHRNERPQPSDIQQIKSVDAFDQVAEVRKHLDDSDAYLRRILADYDQRIKELGEELALLEKERATVVGLANGTATRRAAFVAEPKPSTKLEPPPPADERGTN
jgi:hypothetical protein